jgi:hypothetical protein
MLLCDTLDIAYCNVRGLNDTCFNELVSSIHTCKYQIIVASETWFLNRNKYKSHSFYLQESSYTNNPSTNRRQDGGLLLLASPSISKNITITYTSKYSIKIQIINSKQLLAFVYFPPSLSEDLVSDELAKIGKVDAIIGDLNIRLGTLSGDKTTSAPKRKHILYGFNSQYHLRYKRNDNIIVTSRTDHIFSNINTLKWTYIKPTFPTDHSLMSIQFLAPNISIIHSDLGSKRYDLKPLYNDTFRKEFVSIYEYNHAINIMYECEAALELCLHSMILPNTRDTQEIIDNTYEHLINTIKDLLDTTLTSYDAQAVKSKPDTLLLSSSEPTSNQNIIRSFKRWQRNANENCPIISSDPNKSPLEECKTHYEHQFNSNEDTPTIERQNNIEFSLLFTEHIISERILLYSNTKSVGPDNIHTLVWKTLTNSSLFLRSLSALFQIFAATSLVPSNWSIANLHLLKKNSDNPIAPNTRPIALCNILRRIFEQLVLRFWMDANAPWTQLNYGQAGFRRGYSTISHLILSDELSRRNTKFSIFLDIKSAFDSISWKKLNEVLIAKQCPDTHRNLILSLICKPASLLLSVNHSERIPIKTKKGVFQGGGISAFIFTLYIDPLAKALNDTSSQHQPHALLFADDIQLKFTNQLDAQKALDICTRYGQDYNLKWNLLKCAVVSNYQREFYLDNQIIPNSTDYKYLGFFHTANGLDLQKSFTAKLKQQTNLLTTLLDNNWHPKTKLTIFKTYLRSITEYTSVLTYIWAQKSQSRSDILTMMKKQHQAVLKWIFSKKQYLEIFDYISGLGSWKHRLECLRASLSNSLQNMTTTNPIIAAKNAFLISSSSHSILQDSFKSPYWSEFRREKSNDPMKPLQLKTWTTKKLKLLARTSAKSSALIAYLGNYDPSTSKHFFNLPNDLLFDALSWRLNYSFALRKCICHSVFNRSHVDCTLQNNELYETHLVSNEYSLSLKSVSSYKAPHYSVLDYLLNICKFDDFSTLFSAMKLRIQ